MLLAALLVAAALASPSADLRITVWPKGRSGPAQSWTLRCGPAGGTLPGRATACRRLLALESPFAPTPPDAVCTQLYGGPQVATVRGTLRGRAVKATFARRDGCEIARWNRVRFLLVS